MKLRDNASRAPRSFSKNGMEINEVVVSGLFPANFPEDVRVQAVQLSMQTRLIASGLSQTQKKVHFLISL